MQDIMQSQEQIKVKTRKFSLRKGCVRISFDLDEREGFIDELWLKQRGALNSLKFPFKLTHSQKGVGIRYKAVIDVKKYNIKAAFWDVVAVVRQTDDSSGEERHEAILGGLSTKLKLKLILFPRWTRTDDGSLIYPFVNGARQFTIQYRKYDRKYDSYRFIAKEWLALFGYLILKPYWDHKKIWLICEKYCSMAQDNGLYFFRYCMKNAPDDRKKNIFYVIDKNVPDYEAVREYDSNVIQFMSFKYMIILNAAQYLISTDAIRHFYIWDSPNSVYKVLYQARKNIIFLQHGVMGFKQCHRTFHKSGGNRMALFVVSSEYEQKIIHDYFEYDNDEIIITGLARWDVLEDKSVPEHREILLMPTWRSWLENASDEEFIASEYYMRYEELLSSDELKKLLVEKDVRLNFYIHPKFREHIGRFSADSEYIQLIPFGDRPLNELLMSCNMLITDYSSVAWDVYYQEKPVVFYPFDLDTYEKIQGSYMDYRKEVFGEIALTKQELIHMIESYVDGQFREKEEFVKRREYLLPLRDDRNSKRIYDCIVNANLPNKLGKRLKNRDF